jgi:N-acetylmuramoyl-L-alanine amidase
MKKQSSEGERPLQNESKARSPFTPAYPHLQGILTTANFFRMRRRIACVMGIAFIGGTVLAANDWTVIRQNGRDYVSFSNVARFYQFPEYTRVSRTVSLRGKRGRIRAQAGTSDLYINGVRFFTDFPILSNGDDELISAVDVNKIIQPILRAHEIKNTQKIVTIVLDPGHGGIDSGATNRWGTEKSFALDVARTARQQLVQAGYKVEMTRSSDTFVSLDDRVRFANRFEKALFVSIHFNTSGTAEGLETYALAPAGVASNAANEVSVSDVRWCSGNAQDEQNIALAAAVHAMSLSQMSMFDRGVKHSRFHVLRNVKLPAILIECGFLSNVAEGQRIATPLFRQQIGTAIAQGLQRYDAAVNFRAEAQTLAMAKPTLPLHSRSISEPLSEYVPADSTRHEKPSISISGGE